MAVKSRWIAGAAALGLGIAAGCAQPGRATAGRDVPRWRALPLEAPKGNRDSTGSYVVEDRAAASFVRPRVVADDRVCGGRKRSRVAVLVYDPVLKCEGGKRVTEWLNAADPVEYSHIMADVVRQAS